MKCEATSNTTHSVLISKEIDYKSYKEICSGEPKKVNLGYLNGDLKNIDGTDQFKIEKNSLVHTQNMLEQIIQGKFSSIALDWEVLSKFFSIYNIKQNWLDCNKSTGYFDEELGGWTGCMGKVWGTE